MKQVIIRIRDVDGKLRAKEYFTSVAQFEDFAADYIEKNLGTCYEVEVKVGNQFKAYKLETELLDEAIDNNTTLWEQIDAFLATTSTYVRNYLPRF